MRIWDLGPERMFRQHLMGEHRKLHNLWVILMGDKLRYARHPETRRCQGKLKALYGRHERLSAEMAQRGYRHGSPLPEAQAIGLGVQEYYKGSPADQVRMPQAKAAAVIFRGSPIT